MHYYDAGARRKKLIIAGIVAMVVAIGLITAFFKPNTPPEPPGPSSLYTVLSVTDGDTIRVDYDGTSTPVRLIGVNTPETVDPRKSVECFGVEASNYLKSLLSGRQVTLEADPTQTDRDKYNRLLRYVYLDGEDINLKIITEGYGYEYTYSVPYQKQSIYKDAEHQASLDKRGLWSPSACQEILEDVYDEG